MRRPAFTLLELVACLAVLGILLALLLPAIIAARESSRRMECSANLKQIGIAIAAYEAQHQMFPPGGAYGASMHVVLLPFLDQQSLYDRYDFIKRDDSAVRTYVMPLYICPSDPALSAWPSMGSWVVTTNYAGNAGTGVIMGHGYNGMFRHISPARPPLRDGPIRAQDVKDGLSNTASVSEILHTNGTPDRLRVNWNTPARYPHQDEFVAACAGIPPVPTDYGWAGDIFSRGQPWTVGDVGITMYNHVLGPNQPSCYNAGSVQDGIYSAASAHNAGVNLLFADGHLNFISASVDIAVWQGFGSRVESDLVPVP
jgi:prepilin-type N-terminal cleavage/methylation domain-containing protein/prepilin-type processing-associated H-X9-DG protein